MILYYHCSIAYSKKRGTMKRIAVFLMLILAILGTACQTTGAGGASEDSQDAADLFPVAMENNFKVGKVVIDAILRGQI